ncbi:hypothetical protein, partial [Aeromonas sp. HZM]|uniref:hypothetical protein n=1 Tax=Aeromonas sp. HZM TaxID=1454008 RepID=UPI001F3BF78D
AMMIYLQKRVIDQNGRSPSSTENSKIRCGMTDINDLIHRLGWERATGLSKIIDLVASTDEWSAYTNDLSEWLESKSDDLREDRQVA